jgi:hypothetical protein
VLHLWSAFVVIWRSVGTEFSKMSLMLLLEPKDGISAQSRDVAEDESGQSYPLLTSWPAVGYNLKLGLCITINPVLGLHGTDQGLG